VAVKWGGGDVKMKAFFSGIQPAFVILSLSLFVFFFKKRILLTYKKVTYFEKYQQNRNQTENRNRKRPKKGGVNQDL